MRALLLLLAVVGHGVALEATLVVPQDVHRDYLRLLDGRDPVDLADYAGPGSRRDVVELVLVQQALRRGGYVGELGFAFADSYQRIAQELADGRVALSGTSMWASDLTALGEAVRPSPPVVPRGMFRAGLFATPATAARLVEADAVALRDLRVVSNRDWSVDWRTLEGLDFAALLDTRTWRSMVRMVDAGRCDLLLAPFQPTADGALEAEGIRLVPLGGWYVALEGERRFALAAGHPAAADLAPALERGLQAMIADGTVERAYIECGFYRPDLVDWRRLEPLVADRAQP